MKKYKKMILTLIMSATYVASATANQTVTNSDISNTRMEIKTEEFINKLRLLRLQGLKAEKEKLLILSQIEKLSGQGVVDVKETVKNIKKIDMGLPKQNFRLEDKLILNGKLTQNVGYTYKDDVIGTVVGGNSNTDLDFGEILKDISLNSEFKGDAKSSSTKSNKFNDSSFKLLDVELEKLMLFGDKNKGTLKIKYITNNGYQKIKGYKTVSVSEGDEFNIKGRVYFKIISINKKGITFENTRTKEIDIATK